MVDLALPRLAHGSATLASAITATATTIPLAQAGWATTAAYYPLSITIDGELISVGGVTNLTTQTFIDCVRSVNGVVRSHAAGTPVEVARPIRLGLGHATHELGLGSIDTTPPDPGGGDGGDPGGGDPGGGGAGEFSVSGGDILSPSGNPFDAAGMNAAVNIAFNSGDPGPYVFEGLPGSPGTYGNGSYDIWPGEPNLHSGSLRFPGGGVAAASVFSPELGAVTTVPDRAYALNGVLSASAQAHGINQPVDHWHQGIMRVTAVPRGGGDNPTPAVSIPQYVSKAQQLVDLGLIVMLEVHNQTGANTPCPANFVADPTIASSSIGTQVIRDAVDMQDAMVAAFATDGTGSGPGSSNVRRGNVWLTLPNEPWSGGVDSDYEDWVVTQVRRIRAAGAENIISIPLANFGQGLGGIVDGDYTNLRNTLDSFGVGHNLVWEWHAYGADLAAGGSGSYTGSAGYARMDAHLAACSTGVGGHQYPIVVGEYGQAVPVGAGNAGPDSWNREALLCLATSTYGTPLALKHRVRPIAWHGTGDATFYVRYKLCYGPNVGDENEANGWALPIWDIDGTNLGKLTDFGRAHWDLSHAIAGQVGIPAPSVPTFSSGTATVISTGQDAAAIVAAGSTGDHFYIESGAIVDEILAKTDMHIRFEAGATFDGTGGSGYFVRPESASTTGVVIGADPAGARPRITGYGNGTSSQGWGCIMGRPHDTLGGASVTYENVTSWFIYHLNLDENASQGIKAGDGWTIYDCEIHGHSVAGLNCDRGALGSVVHSNIFYWNALNPSTGASANGAHVKYTWCNADPGRTSQTPIDRAKGPIVIAHNVFEGLDRNGGPGDTNIAVWLDLDCQDALVANNTFTTHPTSAIYVEGGNAVEARYNTITGSTGYGPAFNSDYRNAALCAAESTNCWFHHNTLIDCDWTIMNRLSNRTSDWLDPVGSFNYAYSPGPRYWILDSTPIPAADPPGQSNIWTGNNRYEDNTLINCSRVVIHEGTNNGGQTTHGATPIATIEFNDNDYSQSPGIQFYDRSNTALSLAQWQALGRQ